MHANGAPKEKPAHHPVIRFFVLTVCISWLIWIPEAAYHHGIGWMHIPVILSIVVGGFAPSLAAIVLTAVESGADGIKQLLARLVKWRVSILWYGVALFLPLVILLCGIQISRLWITLPALDLSLANWREMIALFLFTLIMGGPLGEELGWRGYALPRLLESYSGLVSGLIVGAVWGLWHLPLFFIPDTVQARIPVGWFMASILAESLIYTFLHQRTDGSLLIMVLLHAATNTWARIVLLPTIEKNIAPMIVTFSLEIVFAVVLVLLVRSLRQLPSPLG